MPFPTFRVSCLWRGASGTTTQLSLERNFVSPNRGARHDTQASSSWRTAILFKMARTNEPIETSANYRLYNVPEVSYGSVHISDNAVLSSSLNPASNGANKNPTKGTSGFASTRSVATDSPATQEHLGKHRQYWRDIILGGKLVHVFVDS